MSSMAVMSRDHEWTVDDLVDLPDDGLQYELLDGVLLVSPAPVPLHQRVVLNIAVLVKGACPPGYQTFIAPLDWQPDRRTSLQPDVLVIRPEHIGARNVSGPLVLAVEVLSPSTRRKDQVLKRSKYADSGVEHYWMVDPQGPSIEALRRVDGRYEVDAFATGDDSVTIRLPFPVTLRPVDLIAP